MFFHNLQKGPLIILSRVRRCSSEEDGFALGLEFLRTPKAQRRALERVAHHFVERHGG